MLFSSLLPLLPLALPIASAYTRPVTHTHNLHNPYRRHLKRSLTTDASSVDGQSFDFIIAGGGVAGLSLAARLSEWSNVTVLCIEAGGDGSDVEDQIDIPGYSYLNSLTGTAYDWQYTTVVQDDAMDSTKSWPRGKGLGGSGAINGLFWGRASSSEYDAWSTLNPDGDETWDWAVIDQYIKKAENYTAPNSTVIDTFSMVINETAHGDSGPIQAGYSEYIFSEVANWIPAWVTLGLEAKDLSGGSTHGATISTSTLVTHNQTRSDSKAGYIDPLPPRSNLVILTGQQVTSVIFNGTTDDSGNIIASGVTFQASSTATEYSVQANKEVLLSGGVIGSPQLLQLSGIGPSSVLEDLDIDVLLDLPVGYNLQDHISYTMYWETPQGTFTWNNLSVSTTLQATELTEYENYQAGMWTYVNEAVGYPDMGDIMDSDDDASDFADTIDSDIDTIVTDVTSWLTLPDSVASGLQKQYAVQQEWLTEEVGQLEIILTMLGNGGNEVGIQVALQHPWSRGTIFINTTDPFEQPLIDPKYFSVDYDIQIMNYGSAFARRLAAASPLSDIMTTEAYPGSTVTDESLSNYTKTKIGTEYHPLGTCAMMPQDEGGVVATNLTVYGTANLRVIDTSIIPIHLSAHTMGTTYAIAEKAADMIKKTHQALISTDTTSSSSVAATTATAGKATDTAVTNAGSNVDATDDDSTLSSGAKIGIGIGAGVGAAAALAGLLIFFLVRKRSQKKKKDEKGWYNEAQTAWDHGGDPDTPYKETPGPAYPMAAFDSHDSYASPSPAFGHSRNQSFNTIATADLASRSPMRNSSSFSYAAGGLAPTRDGSPYRDDGSDDGSNQGHVYAPPPGGQGPTAPAPGAAAWREEQRYHPVNIR